MKHYGDICKGTALWSSEIDKNAVAVAKYHFPEAE